MAIRKSTYSAGNRERVRDFSGPLIRKMCALPVNTPRYSPFTGALRRSLWATPSPDTAVRPPKGRILNRAVASIATSVLGLSFLGIAVTATPAQAAGTTAGTTIVNSASISFQVNTITQTAITSAGSVTVDRVINLLVAEAGWGTTTVRPGQTRAVAAFMMANTSNATLDFLPLVGQAAGGAAAHGDTDTFDVTNGSFFVDTNVNGVFDSGIDTEVTFFDEVPADTSRTFFYVADIPTDLVNGAVAGITVTVTAREGGTTGTQGVELTQATGANTAAIDTIFADGAGSADAARDGAFSAKGDYTVFTAALSAFRSNMVISDPVNGTNNPKTIPGALVEFCLAVSNAAGAATASDITIAETLAANLIYDSTFGIYENGTVTNGNCNTSGAGGGTTGGTYSGGKLTGTIGTLAAGETRTVRYRATVN